MSGRVHESISTSPDGATGSSVALLIFVRTSCVAIFRSFPLSIPIAGLRVANLVLLKFSTASKKSLTQAAKRKAMAHRAKAKCLFANGPPHVERAKSLVC
jgi:hypothetical protein